MDYSGKLGSSGAWLDKKNTKSPVKAKLVSEAKTEASNFKDDKGNTQTQEVAKILVNGETEAKNIAINNLSIRALADAFGSDSKNWQGHELMLVIKEETVAGKRRFPAYLLPRGYELGYDENDYQVIRKIGSVEPVVQSYADHLEDEVKKEDLPF